jgi:hypothetical protein
VSDNAEFFNAVRPLFSGRMTQAQVDGIKRIINYRDTSYRGVTNAQLAYILATCFHETARRMTPIKEMGSAAYLNSKPYKEKYCGRGLCQITWQKNYEKYNINPPEDALTWPVALHVTFDGMVRGQFTGKKLSDYISGSHVDYIGARRIINGVDRASLIAGYAQTFQAALKFWVPVTNTTRTAQPIKVAPKSILDQIGDLFGIGGEERPAAPGVPMPPPMPAPLTGTAGYTLAAVVAAVGALQTIPWEDVVRNPSVGYPMIISAVGIAVARAVLPSWAQWLVLRNVA